MIEDKKLSSNFWLHEFLRSETAVRHDIDMTPPSWVVDNLAWLAEFVLEPIRYIVGEIIITSGYRPWALNELIKGSQNSDHLRGLAVDSHALRIPLSDYADIVRAQVMDSNLPVHQAIYEFESWVHIGAAPPNVVPKKQLLIAARELGKTVYKPWEAAA